jgi:hypothetical protein
VSRENWPQNFRDRDIRVRAALISATSRPLPASDDDSSFDLQHIIEAALQDRCVWLAKETPLPGEWRREGQIL